MYEVTDKYIIDVLTVETNTYSRSKECEPSTFAGTYNMFQRKETPSNLEGATNWVNNSKDGTVVTETIRDSNGGVTVRVYKKIKGKWNCVHTREDKEYMYANYVTYKDFLKHTGLNDSMTLKYVFEEFYPQQ